jgi:hypothetical protein
MRLTSDHSFPGSVVLDWQLFENLLLVEMSDVYFDGQSRGKARLTFDFSVPASAMSFDPVSKSWRNEASIEPLKDICEFHFKKGKHYSLKGIGATSGKWIAVSVISSEASVTW